MNNILTIGAAFYVLKQELERIYDASEAAAIAHEVLEYITGLGKLQRISAKDEQLTMEQLELFNNARSRLMTGEPLQYVTGIQWFMGKPFQVNKHVLIPRPETEELVQWIADEHKTKTGISILDIGTGSGCIPISLKLKLSHALVTSCDISTDALTIAQSNARKLEADVQFVELDFLHETQWAHLKKFDVIVSNPPYIPKSEEASLDKNVRDFEPGMALFVPDNDALLFYRKIAMFGKTHLKPEGAIYCELHRDYAKATQVMFEQMGYASVVLKKDMHGNDRMLKAML